MGDIAFLLIIFFVICSQFKEVNINPPRSLDAVNLKSRPKITVEIDAKGNIYFQGLQVPNAEAIEWGVRSLLEGKTTEKFKMVMFRCDRSVGKDTFEPVIEAIAKGGGLIAAVGEKPKEGGK